MRVYLTMLTYIQEKQSVFQCLKRDLLLTRVACTINILQSSMEQRTLKSVNNCLNTNIYSYLETSGGKVLIYI